MTTKAQIRKNMIIARTKKAIKQRIVVTMKIGMMTKKMKNDEVRLEYHIVTIPMKYPAFLILSVYSKSD